MENFNGEFRNQLLNNFKIPLKVPSENNQHNAGSGNVQVPADCTSHRNMGLSTSVMSYGSVDNEPNPRKRKQTPCPLKTTSNTNWTEVKIYGRKPAYPDELNELIQPLACNLCKIHVNSTKVAVIHYDSKTHNKKIANWLFEWSNQTGGSLSKIAKANGEGLSGPAVSYCAACELILPSLHHAVTHYSGKRHKRVVAYASNASGEKDHNSNGKGIKMLTKNVSVVIGSEMAKFENQEKIEPGKYCDVCHISVTSELHMEAHLRGSKHGKKLKQLGNESAVNVNMNVVNLDFATGKAPYATPDDTILASIESSMEDDSSMYRTPSGSYYCKICDISLLDTLQLKEHLAGKRHGKNLKSGTTNGGNGPKPDNST